MFYFLLVLGILSLGFGVYHSWNERHNLFVHGAPIAGMFGYYIPPGYGPGIKAHETCHYHMRHMWLILLVRSMGLFGCYAYYGTFLKAWLASMALTVLTSWTCEFLADIAGTWAGGFKYWDEVRNITLNDACKQGMFKSITGTILAYPPYRLLLFI